MGCGWQHLSINGKRSWKIEEIVRSVREKTSQLCNGEKPGNVSLKGDAFSGDDPVLALTNWSKWREYFPSFLGY